MTTSARCFIAARFPLRLGLPLLTLLVGAAACDDGGPEEADPCANASAIAGLKLNQVQVLGSHNSYRRRTYPPIFALIQGVSAQDLDPASLDYDHPPLPEQLDRYGVRELELDLFNDPEGGRFASRMGLQFVGEPTASNLPELDEPGFKVLHVPDFDYETNYLTFRAALTTLRAWSDAHPRHLPLFVHLENKETTVAEALMAFLMMPGLGLTTALPFDAAAADALDAEIRGVFPEAGRIIAPDDVRGTRATLEEAVRAGEWPSLESSRGRIVFYMEGPGVDDYLAATPNLEGRASFVTAQPGQPQAAFILTESGLGDEPAIADLVQRGYIVRTRTDANTTEARTGDTARREAGFRSGAQLVSTDYYRPDPRGVSDGSTGWTTYSVALPGGSPGRINPVNGSGSGRICE